MPALDASRPSAGSESPVAAQAAGGAGGAPVSALVFEGTSTVYGSAGSFRLVTEPDGRFLLVIEGPLPERLGFDGTTAWAVDWSGMPRTLGPGESRAERIGILAWTRPKIAAETLAAARAAQSAGEGTTRTLTRTGLEGTEVWTYEGSIDAGGFSAPRRVHVTLGGEPSRTFEVARAARHDGGDASAYERPRARPGDVRFDPARPSRISIVRARSGHVLAKVSIDGATPAWFILDTGAGGAAVLDTSIGAALDGPALGTVPAIGVFGVMHMAAKRGRTLAIGPVVIERPFLLEQDLSFLAGIHDEPILGILGYDLFARVVAVIDLGEDAIDLFDPAAIEAGGARSPAAPEAAPAAAFARAVGGAPRPWEPLTLDLRVPQVPGADEKGRRGQFRIDIGAAGPGFGNVAFHTPTVRAEKLLEGRSLRRAQLGADPIAFGTLEYFELGGCSFDDPTVLFAEAESGPLADAETAGNLGVDFLKPFRLVLDYSRERFAFARKECPKWTNAGHPDPTRGVGE